MGAMVVPNAVQIRLIWALSGNAFANNVLGALKTGAVTVNQALADSLGTAIKSSFTSSGLDALMPDGISLQKIGVRDVSTANLAEFIDSGAANAGGEVGGQVLPMGTAFVVTLRTALAGKRYRGRVYLPAPGESQHTTGSLSVSAANACVAFITAIDGNLTAAGLDFAVLSRPVYQKVPDGEDVLIRAGVATPITSIIKRQDAVATQRRRMDRFRS